MLLTLVAGLARESAAGDGSALAGARSVAAARAAAVASGNESAFMATVDPQGSAEFVDGQRQSFRGLMAVPIEDYRLTVRLDNTGDLAVSGLAANYGGDQVFIPETEARYRMGGWDAVDDVDTQWLTYVKRDAKWYVGGTDDLYLVGLDTERNIWDVGPIITIPSEHFLVITRPDLRERGEQISRIAENAMVEMQSIWSVPWDEKMPIILPSSADELERILQTTFDLDNFVAFVSYSTDPDANWQSTAPRMYIQDERLNTYGEGFQTETLVHELVHAAMSPGVGPFIESWVHEGVADWYARGRQDEGLPAASDGEVPQDFEFTTGGGDAIRTSYAESRSAISFLGQSIGGTAPDALWQALGAVRVEPGDAEFHTSRALESVGAGTLDQFQDNWGGSARR